MKGHFSLRILPIWTAVEPYAGPEYSKEIGILVTQFSQAESVGEPKLVLPGTSVRVSCPPPNISSTLEEPASFALVVKPLTINCPSTSWVAIYFRLEKRKRHLDWQSFQFRTPSVALIKPKPYDWSTWAQSSQLVLHLNDLVLLQSESNIGATAAFETVCPRNWNLSHLESFHLRLWPYKPYIFALTWGAK